MDLDEDKLAPVELKLKELIINQLKLNLTANELDATAENFLDAHGYNSVDALELLLVIEKEFGIEINDEDLDASLLGTIRGLAAYVAKALARA